MNKGIITFLLSFVVVFAGGYLFYQMKSPEPKTQTAMQTTETESKNAAAGQAEKQAEEPAAPAPTPVQASATEGEIFTKAGCIACHSVSALNVQGGATGPDLSKAYVNVKDKHGVPIEEFLKKPTSAVMSSVLGAKPLTDEERNQVLAALKLASEK